MASRRRGAAERVDSSSGGKTNAMRLLERAGVAYEARSYPQGDEHKDATEVAAAIGLPAEQTYKTLVARGDVSGVLFAVIAADQSLDLKALARASGDKRVALVRLDELTALTGYLRGGCTAIAAKKAYPVVADELIVLHERVAVSAGVRGTQLVLAPDDYVRVTGATLAPIGR